MVELHYQLDSDGLKTLIEEATSLEENQALFDKLAEVQRIKAGFQEVADLIDKHEREVKAAINQKAKALYGPDWTAIAGQGYKITRSKTGSVYDITGKPPKDLVEVKTTVKTKLVDEYVKSKGKLPKGIELNPKRGESIRIKVTSDD